MPADGESMENEGFAWDFREPEAAALREAMGTFPTGVTVLTSGHGEESEGMTANAVISVSLSPLLFLVSVHRETRIAPRIKETGCYAVSLLSANQEGLSRLFASPERSSGVNDGPNAPLSCASSLSRCAKSHTRIARLPTLSS